MGWLDRGNTAKGGANLVWIKSLRPVGLDGGLQIGSEWNLDVVNRRHEVLSVATRHPLLKVTGLALALLLATSVTGCLHPWMPVLCGMQNETIATGVSVPSENYNAKRPRKMAESPSNVWVLFVYEPEQAPLAHAAFSSFTKDCFLHEVMFEKDEDDEPKPYHAAVCAQERTPAPPEGAEVN